MRPRGKSLRAFLATARIDHSQRPQHRQEMRGETFRAWLGTGQHLVSAASPSVAPDNLSAECGPTAPGNDWRFLVSQDARCCSDQVGTSAESYSSRYSSNVKICAPLVMRGQWAAHTRNVPVFEAASNRTLAWKAPPTKGSYNGPRSWTGLVCPRSGGCLMDSVEPRIA